MGRVVVVTFDENEKEKLNELLHFLSAKKYSEMPGKQNRVLDYGALKINAEYRSVESNGELVQFVYGDTQEIIEDCLDVLESFIEEVIPKERKDQ